MTIAFVVIQRGTLRVIPDKEIEVSVEVIVEKRCLSGKTFVRDPVFLAR